MFIVSLPLVSAATYRGPGSAMDTGDSGRRQRDENSVRVTNLSEDVTEADLQVYSDRLAPSVVCSLLWIRPLERTAALRLLTIIIGE